MIIIKIIIIMIQIIIVTTMIIIIQLLIIMQTIIIMIIVIKVKLCQIFYLWGHGNIAVKAFHDKSEVWRMHGRIWYSFNKKFKL